MIATVIPFLLLATLPDDTTWEHGPVYKFIHKVEISLSGIHGSTVYGLHVTNKVSCQPKGENLLKCHFKYWNLMNSATRTDPDEEDRPMKGNLTQDHPELFESFYFDISFDKEGVHSLIINEGENKGYKFGIAKTVAKGLNVGIDLTSHQNADGVLKEIVGDTETFSECEGTLDLNFAERDSHENKHSWSLETTPPLDKLEGREFNLMKTWNSTDCKSFKKFFWAGFIADNIYDDEELKMLYLRDKMKFDVDDYEGMSAQKWQRPNPNKNGRRYIEIAEIWSMKLKDIESATENFPEIENPVTIMYTDAKNSANAS